MCAEPGAALAGQQDVELLPARRLPVAPENAALPGTRAPLELSVNGVAKDVAIAVLQDADVWIGRDDLERAGLKSFGGDRIAEGGRTWVSLRSLAPALTYAIDEAALVLRLDVSAALLGANVVDLRSVRRPAFEQRGDAAAFLNYAVTGTHDGRALGTLEAGASAGGWAFTSAASRDVAGNVSRGMTSAVRDLPERMLKLTAGDLFSRGGALGGSVLVGGFAVERDFGLDPYFVEAPLPSAQAVALTPSILEVYVDGTLASRQEIPAGTVDLSNLPVTAGRSSMRAVIRDAFGRTQELASEHYTGEALLAPGLHDFSYAMGFTRESFTGAGVDYRRALAIAQHRVGVTPWASGGIRLEGGLDRVSGGPSVTVVSPLGELALAGGLSGHERQPGYAGALAWSWRARTWGAGATLRARSDRYADAALDASEDRATREGSAYLALPLARRVSLHVESGVFARRDAATLRTANARVGWSLPHGVNVHVGAGWNGTSAGQGGTTGLLLLSWSPRARVGLELGTQADAGRTTTVARVQQSLPRGSGVGYRFEGTAGDGGDAQQARGELAWQSDSGRMDARFEGAQRQTAGSVTISGALVAAGGGLFLSRAVQDGFAIVEVPSVPGVRVNLENQEVGRTNRQGRLLVPDLLPYQANRLSITASDIPLDYDLGALERVVAPMRRGAARVRFEVEKVRSLTGTLTVDLPSGPITPAYGELTVVGIDGGSSPIGSDGRFYLEKVPAGRHRATVVHGGGVCEIALDVPERPDLLLDLGALRCDQRGASASTGADAGPAANTPAVGPPSASTVTTTASGPLASAALR